MALILVVGFYLIDMFTRCVPASPPLLLLLIREITQIIEATDKSHVYLSIRLIDLLYRIYSNATASINNNIPTR